MCTFLLLFSSLTMFIASLGANFEYDLKKIIALSTLSQLGLIVGAVSGGFGGELQSGSKATPCYRFARSPFP
jgi:NADH:ubiquinone oxidoreductase subunit 5 (subunit L)/multisubunit Na+/H+ antiporter MnhA subunit